MQSEAQKIYEKLYDDFMAIQDKDTTYSNQPVDVSTAEAAQLGIVAKEDRQSLLDAGIAPVFVDTLSDRAAAYSYAAALYQTVVEADPEAIEVWKELAPKGREVRKYLLKFMTFAYRGDEGLSTSVKQIKEGRGNSDMIIDLLSSSILAESNPDPLQNMTMFDMSKITEAKELHGKLNEAYARSTIDPQKASAAKTAMNRAYTYYKQAADQVKDHGQFVYDDTDRYQAYVNDYRSALGKKSANTPSTPTSQQ